MVPVAGEEREAMLRGAFQIETSFELPTANGVPLHMVQKWTGHAQLSTTAIYADAVGKEEQDIAARMWG
jgi:site-specific recombinase XerD